MGHKNSITLTDPHVYDVLLDVYRVSLGNMKPSDKIQF